MAFDLFDKEDEVDFEVIVFRSTLPDYKLAYQLNQHLGTKLERWEQDLDLIVKKESINFSTYEYLDKGDQKELYLLKNITFTKVEDKELTLFKESVKEKKFYLIPELSEFDFIIKNCGYNTLVLEKEIKKITSIQLVKRIDESKLKSIDNLIF